MSNATLVHQLNDFFERLPEQQQLELVDFARSLAANPRMPKRSGTALKHLYGSIPADDIAKMKSAIDVDCEQINPSSRQ